MRAMMTGVANKFKGGTAEPTTAFYNTLLLNGIDEYVSVADDPTIDIPTADLSAGIWFNTTATGTNPLIMKGSHVAPEDFRQWHIQVNNGQMRGVLRASSTNRVVNSVASTYNDGNWHLVIVSYDRSGDMTLYIDDAAGVTTDISVDQGTISSTNPLWIGKDDVGVNFLDGSVSPAFLWSNKIISSAERNIVYNLGLPKQPEDYSAAITGTYAMALPLNDGVASPYVDQSANTNDGVATGSPTFTTPQLEFDLT